MSAILNLPANVPALWNHQREAIDHCKQYPAAMLPLKMGGGKSRIIIELIKEKNYQKVLIICPKSVVPVWPTEFKKYTSGEYYIYPLTKGTVATKTKEAKDLLDAWKGIRPVVLVINYESAREETFAKFALKAKFDLVVADESHRIKDGNSATGRFFYQLGRVVNNKVCLSGTPLAHSPLDVFGQYKFLDANIFGRSFTAFRARYCEMNPYSPYPQIIKYQNLEELNRKFYSIAYRPPEKLIDLPPAIHTYRYCQLSDKAMRTYRTLEREFYAAIADGEVTVSNALVKLLRLQQITGGHLHTDTGHVVAIDNAKATLLQEVLEDIDTSEPLVIFARFKADLEAIQKVLASLSRSNGELSGNKNDLAEWQAGKLNTLVTQIRSGNAGIDLTRACHCVYYSVGSSVSEFEQSLARLHRPGQKNTVTYYHLLAQKTVDEKVYKAIQQHQDIITYVMAMQGDSNE